jgi:membrane protein DedA with SNARE-associated domain
MSAQLPGVLHSLSGVLNHYGYAAVIALVGIEGFGLPAPGQTILIAAGVYAGAGQLNLALVLACGVAAAVCGDNLGYAIGHYGGRPLVLRFGRYVGLSEDRLADAERFFTRHGNVVVPVARFIDGLRQANGIVAGLACMPWWRFLFFNFIGALAWVCLWVTVGHAAGAHIDVIYAEFNRYEKYILAVVGVVVITLVMRWLIRRRKAARDEG